MNKIFYYFKFIFFIYIVIFFSNIFLACNNKPKGRTASPDKTFVRIQKATMSGSFYPAEKNILSKQIDNFIDKAIDFNTKNKVIGMMVPHAGYIYSGPIAGYAYKFIKSHSYKTIIILAPSHFESIEGISVLNKDYYSTPLGQIPIDTNLVETLLKTADWIKYNPDLYKKEHSLDVHIPFIQKSAKDFKIVPIIMGNNSIRLSKNLADVLYNLLENEDFFVIASSDLSHYFSYEEAIKKDTYTLNLIKSLDSETLYKETILRNAEACGLGPVITLMELLKKYGGNKKVNILKYANSGDTAGQKDKVVGYGTAAFTLENYLSFKDKKKLIDLAKISLERYVRLKEIPKIKVQSPALKAEGAAFVTLKKKGRLRGCIGHLFARMPLYLTIQKMTIAACSEDTRFIPVKAEELEDIELEISVMTPMQPVIDPKKIIVGKDGLFIMKNGRQGVLLPQVPLEFGWTRKQFLRQTSIKAGLPPDAWKKGSELFKFQAIVFSEKDIIK